MNPRAAVILASIAAMVSTGAAQVIPISDVRVNDDQGVPDLYEQEVTVTGVVTEAGHFGGWGPAFIRDNTGDVALYGSPCGSMAIGDSVTVTGTVDHFSGLTEIASFTVQAHGNVGTPDPEPFALADVGNIDTSAGYVENEARLVRFPRIWIEHTSGERFEGNTNYAIYDGAFEQGEMRIDRDAAELVGQLIPDDSVALTGLIGQYQPDPPHFGGYQVMPRTAADLGISVSFMPIAEATKDENLDGIPDRLGESVLVTGIVTVPSGVFQTEHLDIFIQDSTGGVNVFDFDYVQYDIGDSLSVTGEIDWFAGMTELTDITVEVLATGLPEPAPRTLTVGEVNGEPHEGELVRLYSVRTDGGELQGNWSYDLWDASDTTELRIDEDTDIPGLECPADTFALVGIKAQFADSTEPLTGYQVKPRFRTDFSFAGAILEKHREERRRVRIVEATVVAGHLFLRGSEPARLLDIAGREVLSLRPGANDMVSVRQGVYFVVGQSGAGRTKVLVQR